MCHHECVCHVCACAAIYTLLAVCEIILFATELAYSREVNLIVIQYLMSSNEFVLRVLALTTISVCRNSIVGWCS